MTKAAIKGASPSFIARDIDRTLAFYSDKLGFRVALLQPEQNPFFAIVVRDAAQIFFKSEQGIAPVPNSTRHRHLRWDAYFYVPHPDALSAEFAAHGVMLSAPLRDTHDGLRGFELIDPNGYVLFFGRPR